jgi:hypothetical protein
MAKEHRSEIWIADSAVWRADKGHRKEQSSKNPELRESTKQKRAQSSKKSTE